MKVVNGDELYLQTSGELLLFLQKIITLFPFQTNGVWVKNEHKY